MKRNFATEVIIKEFNINGWESMDTEQATARFSNCESPGNFSGRQGHF